MPAEVRASSEALWRKLQAGGASVTPDFISEEEEALLAQELEPQLRRHRYQDEHWDGVGGSAWLGGKFNGAPWPDIDAEVWLA